VGRGYLPKLPVFAERMRVKAGNRCGYFPDDQYAKLLHALPFYSSRAHRLAANYSARLGAFMDLGRWAGMAVADAVRFAPSANLGANNVLTYRRVKSTQVAKILLDPAVAARMRSIPPEEGSDREQPLRFPSISEDRSRGIWRDRFQRLCARAGITKIETKIGTVRKPHPHMLRDTTEFPLLGGPFFAAPKQKLLGVWERRKRSVQIHSYCINLQPDEPAIFGSFYSVMTLSNYPQGSLLPHLGHLCRTQSGGSNLAWLDRLSPRFSASCCY
jgi:hypothetical protein